MFRVSRLNIKKQMFTEMSNHFPQTDVVVVDNNNNNNNNINNNNINAYL